MKVLWIMFVVSVLAVPVSKPFVEECNRIGGEVQIMHTSDTTSVVRCIKIEKKNDTKESKRIPDSYGT